MNESTNNPLNDFLNQAEEEPENNLFAPIPFPSQPEPAGAAVPVPPPVPAPQAPAAEMPEIPASYILSRNLANAFLDVVKDGRNARETIGTYAVIMDNELERKQKELDARKARS